jgi:hypothetical protein
VIAVHGDRFLIAEGARLGSLDVFAVTGAGVTALGFGIGGDAWGWLVLAAFAVTLAADRRRDRRTRQAPRRPARKAHHQNPATASHPAQIGQIPKLTSATSLMPPAGPSGSRMDREVQIRPRQAHREVVPQGHGVRVGGAQRLRAHRGAAPPAAGPKRLAGSRRSESVWGLEGLAGVA